MTNNPQLSILIPAYDEQDYICRSITSVHDSCDALSWRSYEIVVCDNNSTDETAALAVASGARVVHEPVNLIARARNTAARNALGEWLIFLDADSSLNPEVLKETIRNLQSGQVCGGGSLMRFNGEIGSVAKLMSAVWNWSAPKLSIAAGAFLFCLREAWQGVNGFDEELYVAEDTFFSKRISNWGRARRRKFVLISGSPIITSSRKFDRHGPLRVVLQFLLLCLPGAMKSRKLTKQRYER